MGVLAEFFVADEPEALAYDADSALPESHRVLYKRLTELELGTLYHITLGKEVDDDTFYDFRLVKSVDDGEQLTTELLPDLVARLAGATNDELRAWAEGWGRTEEIQVEGEEILQVLEDLRRLARLAQAESKQVYLWNCV